MNDRFKFRTWYYDKDDKYDSDNNKMFYNAQDTYDCLCGNPPLKASSFGCIVDDECWTVEQCTGLKDKNGKLIYEGDIVKLTQARNKGWMLRGTRLEVKYNIDRYCGFGFDDGYALTEKCAKNCIVIGNIHENADLLEVEND